MTNRNIVHAFVDRIQTSLSIFRRLMLSFCSRPERSSITATRNKWSIYRGHPMMALFDVQRLCLFFCLALAATVCHGKVWVGNARLSPKRSWVPLTNFAFDIGVGEVSVSLSYDWEEQCRAERWLLYDEFRVWVFSGMLLNVISTRKERRGWCTSTVSCHYLMLQAAGIELLPAPEASGWLVFVLIVAVLCTCCLSTAKSGCMANH